MSGLNMADIWLGRFITIPQFPALIPKDHSGKQEFAQILGSGMLTDCLWDREIYKWEVELDGKTTVLTDKDVKTKTEDKDSDEDEVKSENEDEVKVEDDDEDQKDVKMEDDDGEAKEVKVEVKSEMT
jgi:hypothetical protein